MSVAPGNSSYNAPLDNYASVNRDTFGKEVSRSRVGDINLGLDKEVELGFKRGSIQPGAIKKSTDTFNRISKKEDEVFEKRPYSRRIDGETDTDSKGLFSNKWVIIGLAVLFLVLIGVGGGLLYYFKFRKPKYPQIILPVGPGYDEATKQTSRVIGDIEGIFERSVVYPSVHYGDMKHMRRWMS